MASSSNQVRLDFTRDCNASFRSFLNWFRVPVFRHGFQDIMHIFSAARLHPLPLRLPSAAALVVSV